MIHAQQVLLLLTVGGCPHAPHASPALDVLMIQPYVSIVEEKAAELKAIGVGEAFPSFCSCVCLCIYVCASASASASACVRACVHLPVQ